MSSQALQAHVEDVEDPQLFQRLALSERRSPPLWPVEFSCAVVAVGQEPLPSPGGAVTCHSSAAVPCPPTSPPTVSRAATAVSTDQQHGFVPRLRSPEQDSPEPFDDFVW